MLNAFFWALLVTCGCAIQAVPDRVATLTRQFIDTAKTPENLKQFYDVDAVLSADKIFGFGGDYKGPDGVGLFLYRMEQAIHKQPPQIEFIKVDEDRGIALILMHVRGKFIHSQKDFNTTLLHVLEWNQVTGKIITHVVVDTKPSQTLAAYATDAETYFERLLWTLYRSSYEDLTNVNSPIWNLVADDIQVKVNMYPEDLISKSEWRGKSEVLQGFREMATLQQNMPLYKDMMSRSHLLDSKVLVSTNSDIWVRWGCKGEDGKVVTHVIVHYTFDAAGKLVQEDILLAHAARPWQVYPFPAPKLPSISTSEIRKLMDVRNKAAKEISHDAKKPVLFSDLSSSKQSNEEDSKDEKTGLEGLEELELHMPIKVFVDGDVNTRIYGLGKTNAAGGAQARSAQPPMEVDVRGDMKTSIVNFGSGDVDQVKFGSVDDLKVWKPNTARPEQLGLGGSKVVKP